MSQLYAHTHSRTVYWQIAIFPPKFALDGSMITLALAFTKKRELRVVFVHLLKFSHYIRHPLGLLYCLFFNMMHQAPYFPLRGAGNSDNRR
jgi:hypothetical protein